MIDLRQEVRETSEKGKEMIQCQWFAGCTNEADMLARGPVGDGEWGEIPTCSRCVGRFDLEAFPVEFVQEGEIMVALRV